jgi:hypothetical protein
VIDASMTRPVSSISSYLSFFFGALFLLSVKDNTGFNCRIGKYLEQRDHDLFWQLPEGPEGNHKNLQ